MTKPLALFDIDNTMYQGFSYFALLEKQVQEGLVGGETQSQALASMQKYKTKQQDYETTIVELLDIYAQGLKGRRYDAVFASTKEFYSSSPKFFAYVAPVMQKLRSTHDIVLVTGEPHFAAQAVAARFGVEQYRTSEYEVKNGIFTGKVTKYLASRHEKLDAITELVQGRKIDGSFAFGDSEGDIEMLGSVAYGICVNPTEGLRDMAQKQGWAVLETDAVAEYVTECLKGLRVAK